MALQWVDLRRMGAEAKVEESPGFFKRRICISIYDEALFYRSVAAPVAEGLAGSVEMLNAALAPWGLTAHDDVFTEQVDLFGDSAGGLRLYGILPDDIIVWASSLFSRGINADLDFTETTEKDLLSAFGQAPSRFVAKGNDASPLAAPFALSKAISGNEVHLHDTHWWLPKKWVRPSSDLVSVLMEDWTLARIEDGAIGMAWATPESYAQAHHVSLDQALEALEPVRLPYAITLGYDHVSKGYALLRSWKHCPISHVFDRLQQHSFEAFWEKRQQAIDLDKQVRLCLFQFNQLKTRPDPEHVQRLMAVLADGKTQLFLGDRIRVRELLAPLALIDIPGAEGEYSRKARHAGKTVPMASAPQKAELWPKIELSSFSGSPKRLAIGLYLKKVQDATLCQCPDGAFNDDYIGILSVLNSLANEDTPDAAIARIHEEIVSVVDRQIMKVALGSRAACYLEQVHRWFPIHQEEARSLLRSARRRQPGERQIAFDPAHGILYEFSEIQETTLSSMAERLNLLGVDIAGRLKNKAETLYRFEQAMMLSVSALGLTDWAGLSNVRVSVKAGETGRCLYDAVHQRLVFPEHGWEGSLAFSIAEMVDHQIGRSLTNNFGCVSGAQWIRNHPDCAPLFAQWIEKLLFREVSMNELSAQNMKIMSDRFVKARDALARWGTHPSFKSLIDAGRDVTQPHHVVEWANKMLDVCKPILHSGEGINPIGRDIVFRNVQRLVEATKLSPESRCPRALRDFAQDRSVSDVFRLALVSQLSMAIHDAQVRNEGVVPNIFMSPGQSAIQGPSIRETREFHEDWLLFVIDEVRELAHTPPAKTMNLNTSHEMSL